MESDDSYDELADSDDDLVDDEEGGLEGLLDEVVGGVEAQAAEEGELWALFAMRLRASKANDLAGMEKWDQVILKQRSDSPHFFEDLFECFLETNGRGITGPLRKTAYVLVWLEESPLVIELRRRCYELVGGHWPLGLYMYLLTEFGYLGEVTDSGIRLDDPNVDTALVDEYLENLLILAHESD